VIHHLVELDVTTARSLLVACGRPVSFTAFVVAPAARFVAEPRRNVESGQAPGTDDDHPARPRDGSG
jgi:hypothetical protein